MTDDRAPKPWEHSRFQILSQLGQGGMGMVYEAVERSTGRRVALKTMRVPSGDSLLRFKNEFRALQDIHHPNLLSLGDLIEEDGQWWFSMELLRGVNLLAYVRPPQMHQGSVSVGIDVAGATAQTLMPGALAPTDPAGMAQSGDAASPLSAEPPNDALDLIRLREVFAQLVDGLHALHRANKVHRDIKPENVQITTEGRVVILDFGLVCEVLQLESAIVGTIAYMAPEQAAGRPVGAAADWYSVGVLLYESLTNRLPFEGAGLSVLADKQHGIPASPRSLCASTPTDLDTLCTALLKADPHERPKYADIIEVLRPAGGQSRAKDKDQPPRDAEVSGVTFVGRSHETSALMQVFADTRKGHGRTVLLHGESGVGKTALMSRFASKLSRNVPDLIILSGRCYEHEMVPFKAVDGVIDSLTKYLRRQPRDAVTALLPRRPSLLLQVFPVLGMVPSIAEAPALSGHDAPDPQEQRIRFFAALRELLARIAEKHPLLLLIDDIQWTDRDSMLLLNRLMLPPDEPPLMLVATIRSGAEALKESWADPAKPKTEVVHLSVDRLPNEDALELATNLLSRAGQTSPLSPEKLVAETAGHPLFLHALAHHAIGHGMTNAARLEEAFLERIGALPADVLQVLRLSAVMGSPLPLDIAIRASAQSPDQVSRAIAQLRSEYLLRAATRAAEHGSTSDNIQAVEPYHDRVRETVRERLTPAQRKELHLQLALALEARIAPDTESLAFHFERAGHVDKTFQYALDAAANATKALAFERAARFYRQALETKPVVGEQRQALYRQLGEVLANGGRGEESGRAFLEAADCASPADKRELQIRAVAQLLRSGNTQDGVQLLREQLAALGLRYPETPREAVTLLLWYRLRLRLRGLGFHERPPNQIEQTELLQVDVCRAAAEGLSLSDFVRGSMFRAQFTFLALRAGETSRIAVAALLEASMMSADGEEGERAALPALSLSRRIAKQSNRLLENTMVLLSEASIEHNCGRWQRARELFDECESQLRAGCTGVAWELNNARFFSIRCSLYLGEFGKIAARLPADLEEAESRGDLYMELCLRTTPVPRLYLVYDRPTQARNALATAKTMIAGRDYELQHYYWCFSYVEADLYEGKGAQAYSLLVDEEQRLRERFLMRVQVLRVAFTDQQARCALQAASLSSGRERQEWLKQTERKIKAIEKESALWSQALALRLRAGLQFLREGGDGAKTQCATAARMLDAVDMHLHAAAVRFGLGQMLGGEEGKTLREAAESAMTAQGILNPTRFAAMLAPGLTLP